jgi:hypothetical protein
MDWLYENSEDNTSRYILGTVGEKPLVCFGINPSTATPECLDNTLKSVERIALNNGYDSWLMLNVYPQRATHPSDLHSEKDEILHKNNLIHIEKIFDMHKPTIWAAWGTVIEKRRYLKDCLFDIVSVAENYKCQWISFGRISKNGHPHHPLYLKKLETYKNFPIIEYMNHL